jgi:hypothetical protein
MAGLADIYSYLESQNGLPAGYLARTRAIESANGTRLTSPTGAQGPFQFTRGTANAMGLPLNMRNDEVESARAAARLAASNKSILQRALSRDPTAPELYIAHQQGGPGAARLLANPGAPAGTLTKPSNISVNAGDPNKPAGSFVQQFIDRYNKATPGNMGGNVGQGPTVQAAAALPATPATPATPAVVPPKPRWSSPSLLELAQQETLTGKDIMGFMGGNRMTEGLKGAAALAQAFAPPAGPIAPNPITDTGIYEPNLSALDIIKRRKGLTNGRNI